jgi:hypothetical protein
MSRARDVGAQLGAALVQQAAATGCVVRVEGQRQTAWASATFTGARHQLECIAERGPALDAWLSALPEVEFALRGHLVADIHVAERIDGDAVALRIEALTVEEN